LIGDAFKQYIRYFLYTLESFFFFFFFFFIRYLAHLHFQCYTKSPPYPPTPHSPTHPLPPFGPGVPLYRGTRSLRVQWASLSSDGRLGHLLIVCVCFKLRTFYNVNNSCELVSFLLHDQIFCCNFYIY
jgi:hypothetical protein